MAFIFSRTALAEDLAARLLDTSGPSSVASGLFLAAPRRTGKTTFLVNDLTPALREAGAFVLYIDLWRDVERDPAEVILAALAAALADERRALSRIARGLAAIESVSAGGVLSVAVRGDDGSTANVSMTEALLALSDALETTIVMIVDEAQHALTSAAGTKALFALKAARDALNIGPERTHGLRIVATGSNRDKLAVLRNSKDQAFFGAPLSSFPPLGRDYVRWFVELRRLDDVVDIERATRWFERAGYRPEFLSAAADAAQYEIGQDRSTLAARMEAALDDEVRAADEAQLALVRGLPPLQFAVLAEMASKGTAYAPFEGATVRRYAATLGSVAPHAAIEPSDTNVQAALRALKKKGLIWRAVRGVYALEDSRLADLMRADGMIS